MVRKADRGALIQSAGGDNFELLSAKLNRAKSAKIGERQKGFAKELHNTKLLSDQGWAAVKGRM